MIKTVCFFWIHHLLLFKKKLSFTHSRNYVCVLSHAICHELLSRMTPPPSTSSFFPLPVHFRKLSASTSTKLSTCPLVTLCHFPRTPRSTQWCAGILTNWLLICWDLPCQYGWEILLKKACGHWLCCQLLSFSLLVRSVLFLAYFNVCAFQCSLFTLDQSAAMLAGSSFLRLDSRSNDFASTRLLFCFNQPDTSVFSG